MALSSEGIILTWDKGSHTLKTFTVNGIANGELVLPSSDGNVTAVSISADGLNFVIGTNGVCSSQDSEQDTSSGSLSQKGQKFQNSVGNTECNLTTKTSEAVNKDEKEPEETINDSSEYSLTSDSSPSVILLNLYSLKILHRFRLQQGQNVTAIALNQDNTNLIVSTTDRQLLVFADPALSIKIVNQMLVLAGEANGLASYLT
ncbi:hypothetical protein O6H91_19G016200 [Diphasiastrum complanatum]|nr:hypothetical protein O6H91_19G016200 [Diphasiastrum complanatum]